MRTQQAPLALDQQAQSQVSAHGGQMENEIDVEKEIVVAHPDLLREATRLIRANPRLPIESDEDGEGDEDSVHMRLLRFAKQQGIKWQHVGPALRAAVQVEEDKDEPLPPVVFKTGHDKVRANKYSVRIVPPPPHHQVPNEVACIADSVESIEHKPSLTSLEPCSLRAMKVAVIALFHVRATEDTRFWTHTFTPYELSRLLGVDYDLSHEQAQLLIREVAGTHFTIKKKDNTFTAIPIVSVAEFNESTKKIRLRLNPDLKPYLLDLRRDTYRKLHRKSMFALRTQRGFLLYQYLRRFVHLDNHQKTLPMKDVRRILQAKANMP